MANSSAFYFDVLYPFQDRVIRAINQVDTGFYLTGGTASSRGYLHHRFSDDLDYFVNDDNRFGLWVERIIQTLNRNPRRAKGFSRYLGILLSKGFISSNRYYGRAKQSRGRLSRRPGTGVMFRPKSGLGIHPLDSSAVCRDICFAVVSVGGKFVVDQVMTNKQNSEI